MANPMDVIKGAVGAAEAVGASDSQMVSAVAMFTQRYNEFMAAAQNISNDVMTLSATWQGGGYDAFNGAMGKWNTDMGNVNTDLQSMGQGVAASNDVIKQADNNVMRAFNSYQ